MAKKKKDIDRKFLLEVIETYESLPALWKIKSEDYSNRDKKADAYNVLLEKCREHFPAATLDEVKKKINSMRTNFRSELRKMERSAKSGTGADDLYVPTLWYFAAMMFLRAQETTAPSRSTISKEGDEEEQYQEDDDSVYLGGDVIGSERTGSTPLSLQQQPLTNVVNGKSTIKPTPRNAAAKKRRSESKKDELISLATSRLLQESREDEYDIQAKTWANELRNIDPKQQLFAKKAINDVLFEGRCGNLTRTSVQINCNHDFLPPAPARSSTPFSMCSTQSGDSSGSIAYRKSPIFVTNTQGVGNSFVQSNELAEYFSGFQPHTQ